MPRFSRRGGRLVLQNALQQCLPVDGGERRLQGEQLVKRRAQRIDVASPIQRDGPARCLLGAHVAERPHEVDRAGQVAARQLRQAEVRHPQIALRVPQQVARLDVAMHHPALVRVLQGFRRLADHPRGVPAVVGRCESLMRCSQLPGWLHRKRPGALVGRRRPGARHRALRIGRRLGPGLRAQLLDYVRQRAPVHQLHGEVVDAMVLADRVDRNDVRMLQGRRRLGFVPESLKRTFIERGDRGEHLERDATHQGDLFRLVDHAHAAPSEFAEDSVVADDLVRHRRDHRLRLRYSRHGGLHEFQRTETTCQLFSDVGVASRELRNVRRLA